MRRAGRLGDTPCGLEIMHDLLVRAEAINPRSPEQEVALWLGTKPPFADWFIRGESATLAVGDTRIPVTGFRIPEGAVGVLVFFSNAVGSAADYPDVTFEVDIDNAPIQGFSKIIGPMTLAAQDPWRMMVPLASSQVAMVVASNTGVNIVQNVQAFLAGWYWTLSLPAETV